MNCSNFFLLQTIRKASWQLLVKVNWGSREGRINLNWKTIGFHSFPLLCSVPRTLWSLVPNRSIWNKSERLPNSKIAHHLISGKEHFEVGTDCANADTEFDTTWSLRMSIWQNIVIHCSGKKRLATLLQYCFPCWWSSSLLAMCGKLCKFPPLLRSAWAGN